MMTRGVTVGDCLIETRVGRYASVRRGYPMVMLNTDAAKSDGRRAQKKRKSDSST